MTQPALRCKVRVGEVTRRMDHEGNVGSESVTLYPVTSGSEENKQWSKATPSGKLELQITNPDAYGKLVSAREFYVDFVSIPAAE